MFPVLLLLFIVTSVVEIAILIQVGSFLGVLATIILILLTAVIGASLVRSQGLQTLLTLQQRLAKGELPTEQIIEGLIIVIAGILLLTPGFVTDTLGMLLLLPLFRQLLIKKISASPKFGFRSNFQQDPFHKASSNEHQSHTFEGEFERKKDDDNRLN